MRNVTVAATQMACTHNSEENIDKAVGLIKAAKQKGADIILIQEMFASLYFPCINDPENFNLALPFKNNPILEKMAAIAKELDVVLPVSFFEKDNNTYYNSLAVIDADGSILDLYRKSHIPDGPGYEEKYYFHPGNTGFKVWDTKFGRIGVGICWDQWFPEAARIMALMGAEMIWQIVMQGHAAANSIPIIASNRIGIEVNKKFSMTFYGSSFIADECGQKVEECSRDQQEIIVHEFDLDSVSLYRSSWGFFRDRRTDLYENIFMD